MMKRSLKSLDLAGMCESIHAPKRQAQQRLEEHDACLHSSILPSPFAKEADSDSMVTSPLFSKQTYENVFCQTMVLFDLDILMNQMEVTSQGQRWASCRSKEDIQYDIFRHRRKKCVNAHRRRDRRRASKPNLQKKGDIKQPIKIAEYARPNCTKTIGKNYEKNCAYHFVLSSMYIQGHVLHEGLYDDQFCSHSNTAKKQRIHGTVLQVLKLWWTRSDGKSILSPSRKHKDHDELNSRKVLEARTRSSLDCTINLLLIIEIGAND